MATTASVLLLGLAAVAAHANGPDSFPTTQPATSKSLPTRGDPNRSPFEVDVALDLGITFGGLVVVGLPRLLVEEYLQPSCGLGCDRDDVNLLDRQVIGKHSKAMALVSDVGAGLSMALPFALGAIDVLATDPVDGWIGYGKDVVVLLETLSVTMCVNNILNLLVRRPRPLVYDPDVDDDKRLLGDSALSFPSGHTAGAFAMATAYSYTYMKRHPRSPLVIPLWIGTYGLASATGVLRTEAGDHFWTDVIAGAAMGISLGLLIPYLHLRQGDGRTRATATRFSIAPLTFGHGFGASLTIR